MINPKEDYCTCSPDYIMGASLKPACYHHDRQYRNEVVNRKTRKEADITFRKAIKRILQTSNVPFELRLRIKKLKINILFFRSEKKIFIWYRKKTAGFFARAYYLGVRWFAGYAWVDGSEIHNS